MRILPDRSLARRCAERTQDKPALPWWLAALVAAAGGAVLDLASPAVGWWPLAFVGVSLALLSLIGRSSWGALGVGLVFGASFYLIHISWITRYLGVVPWFALSGVETVFMGLGAILITLAYRWVPRLISSEAGRMVVLPALVAGLWTMRELVMGSWPYTGFPWGRIGMTQSESPLAGVVSWGGVAALTFLMVFFSAAALEWMRVPQRRKRLRFAVPAATTAAFLLLVPSFPTTAAGTVTVGSVQGNGPAGYFDDRAAGEVFRSQWQATKPLFGEEMDLLVWPEGGVDSDPLSNDQTVAAVEQLARRVGAPVLLNAVTTRGNEIFNTSLLWIAGEGEVARYDKTHPTPMGEYVPDRPFFEALAPDLIGLIQREYTPGTLAPYIKEGDLSVGLAICFDVLYDEVIWQSARADVDLYVLQTNNADFRNTDENLQQLAVARMRARETGKSVVNISTVGTSQVIRPDGIAIDTLPADQAGAMLTRVPVFHGVTPAAFVGPAVHTVLGWGSAVGILIAAALSAGRRRDLSAIVTPG